MLRVQMSNAGMGFDACVHQGLCVAWLVTLVMTETPEPDKIQNDIFVEMPAVIECYLHHAIRRFRGVAIYVEDRRLRDLRRVSRVDRASAQFRRCREPDLVVDDDMYSAACSIAGEIG